MKLKSRSLLCTGGLALGLALAGAGQAQDSEIGEILQEITVTATKREAGLQDVAVSISALSSDSVEKHGFVGMGDYLNSLPSVTIQDRGPGRNQVVIRGVSSSAGGVADNTVGIYIGDVPLMSGLGYGANGYPDLKLYDVERIEVLRGPQGTLYGAGSLGGAVKVVPRDPSLSELEASFDVGSSNTRRGHWNYDVGGALNIPLVADRVALRVAAYYYDQSGFIDNRFPGLDYSQPMAELAGLSLNDLGVPDPGVGPRNEDNVGGAETVGARAALRYRPSDALDIVVSYLHQESNTTGLPEMDFPAGDFRQSRFPREPLHDTFDFASLKLEYDFGSVLLTSSTGYMDRSLSQTRDATMSFLNAPMTIYDPNSIKMWNEELRLSSQTEGPLQWIVGGFYQDSRGHSRQDADWHGNDESMVAFFQNIILGAPIPLSADAELYVRHDIIDQQQIAAFGEVSYDFTSMLRVVVGGRWYEYQQDFDGFQDGIFTAGTQLGGQPTIDFASAKESGFNPKLAVELRPTQDQLYYGQVAKGFRLGTTSTGVPDAAPGCAEDLAELGITTADTRRPIKSDSIWSYELGAKLTLAGGRTTVNGAVYYIDWKDIPVFFLMECGYGFSANAGRSSSRGAELELASLVTDGVTLNLGVSYSKPQLEEDTPQATGLGGIKGDRLPGTPDWNIQGGLQYDFDLGQRSAFARADFTYMGSFLNKFPASIGVGESGDYHTLNLRAGLALTEALSAEIFANNITDEKINLIVDTQFGGRAVLGRPRTIGAVMRVRF